MTGECTGCRMKNKKSSFKKAAFIIGAAVTAFGIIDMCLAAREEKAGDFGREFPDAGDEIKNAIDCVKNQIKENEAVETE